MSYPASQEGWTLLISQAKQQNIEQSRPVFQQLVNEFPTCSRFWQSYIESELKSQNFDRVENLFQQSLIHVLHIDLWRCYLEYLQDTKRHLPNYRQIMLQAFEFALDKIGTDISSQPIWKNYLTFLHQCPQTASLRALYLRALNTPMCGIEQIWDDYVSFEMKVGPRPPSPPPDYVRQASIQLEQLLRPINRNCPCKVALSQVIHGFEPSIEEQKQWQLWQEYFEWEKSSNFPKDVRHKRVCYAFEQCLLVFPHNICAWMGYCQYLISQKNAEVQKVFERALSSYMKYNSLMYFVYADYFENQGKISDAEQIYHRLVSIQLENNIDPTLTVINLMRFAWRTSGIDAARKIFCKSLFDCGYQLYTANALMEYHQGGGKEVAAKVFELGMERFSHCPEYVITYLDLLANLNEDYNNTRVLFERTLEPKQVTETQKMQFAWADVWLKFINFECQVGSLSGILSVEKRRIEALENVRNFYRDRYSIAVLCDRYACLGLCPIDNASDLETYGCLDLQRLHTCSLEQRLSVLCGDGNYFERCSLPEPDKNSMLQFTPVLNAPAGSHLLSGGVYREPQACFELMKMLPPPDCFHGPYVMIDKLIDIIASTDKFDLKLVEKPVLLVDITDESSMHRNDDGELSRHDNLFRRRRHKKKVYRRHFVKSGGSHDAVLCVNKEEN